METTAEEGREYRRPGPAWPEKQTAADFVFETSHTGIGGLADTLSMPAQVGPTRSSPSPSHSESWSIQRAPNKYSNPTLLEHYNTMMRSPTFQNLDRQVSKANKYGDDILLRDSDEGAEYNSRTHTIRVPTSRSPAHLRTSLLFEMQNASQGDLFASLHDAFDEGDATPHRRAAFALAMEWGEWISVVGENFRAQQIDRDLGGNQMLLRTTSRFITLGEGWFKFQNFLQFMIDNGHTATYDEYAKSRDWIGESIVKGVISESLEVTNDELADFLSGVKDNIKDPGLNPFTRYVRA